MTEEPSSLPDRKSLEIDLAESFLPSWAKDSEVSARLAKLSEHSGEGDRGDRSRGRSDFGGSREGRGARPNRPSGRGQDGPRKNEGGGLRRGPGANSPASNTRGQKDRDGRGRPGQGRFERSERPAPAPMLEGWNIQFLPEPHGVEGIARQMKADFKAYPLFDLAWLVLERPDRYRVEFKRASETGSALFQLKIDGSLWLSERDAMVHVMSRYLEKFYRRERVTVDPPKGSFPCVAVCGMSGVLLGPPNYHDYQLKILKLHGERFANMPFEAFKSRIRIEREESLIQKWKDELSSKDEFYPLEVPEGSEPQKLSTLAEVEAHFRSTHLPAVWISIREKAVLPGTVALESSAIIVSQTTRRALEELRRFPLSLANTLGRQLTSKGLQIFKAHQKITYVGLARPHYLDRETMPVADGVKAILEYLEAHGKTPRAEQWEALVALRQAGSESTTAESETALAADLLWLLREGHVIDFARKGLEAAKRPQPPQAPKAKKTQEKPESAGAVDALITEAPAPVDTEMVAEVAAGEPAPVADLVEGVEEEASAVEVSEETKADAGSV